jgi:hypothetical protein
MNLGAQNPINYNQLIRWVSNKEDHANEIQEIVSQYFMTQRIKPDTKNYSQKLALLHNMLIYAVEDRTPRVYPWMNELFLVSAIAEVRPAFQSRRPLGPRVYPGESIQ